MEYLIGGSLFSDSYWILNEEFSKNDNIFIYTKNFKLFKENIVRIARVLFENELIINKHNPKSNYELAVGVVNPERYKSLETTFGVKNIAEVKSVDILNTTLNVIKNEVANGVLQFDIHRTDENLFNEIMEELESRAASLLRRSMVSTLNGDISKGNDIGFLVEPDDEKVNSLDDVVSVLKEKDDLEVELYKLITSCIEQGNTKMELDSCMHDKLCINVETGRVISENGVVQFMRIEPKCFFELYGNGKDLSDSLAVGYYEDVSVTSLLNESHKYISLEKEYEKYKKGELEDVGFSYYGLFGSMFPDKGYVRVYKFETSIYRYEKYEIKRNGKTISKKDYYEYKKYGENVSFAEEISFEEIKGKRKVRFKKDVIIRDIWEVEMIGLVVLKKLKKVKSEVTNVRKHKSPSYSFVKYQINEPSLITICSPLEWIISALYYKIQVATLRDKGLVQNINLNTMPNGTNGIADKINEQVNLGLNLEQDNHSGDGSKSRSGASVSNLDTSNSVLNWMAALNGAYRMMSMITGIPLEQLSVIPQDRSLGQSRISLQSSYATTGHLYREHDYFVQMVLSTMLEVGLRTWTDKSSIKFLSVGGKKTYLSSKPFEIGTFELYVKSLLKDKNNKDLINTMAAKFMDRATDLDALKGVMAILTSNSASESMFELERLVSDVDRKMKEEQAAASQARNQFEANRLAIEKASKVDIPMARIQADIEHDRISSEIRSKIHSDKLAFNETKVDFDRIDKERDRLLDT